MWPHPDPVGLVRTAQTVLLSGDGYPPPTPNFVLRHQNSSSETNDSDLKSGKCTADRPPLLPFLPTSMARQRSSFPCTDPTHYQSYQCGSRYRNMYRHRLRLLSWPRVDFESAVIQFREFTGRRPLSFLRRCAGWLLAFSPQFHLTPTYISMLYRGRARFVFNVLEAPVSLCPLYSSFSSSISTTTRPVPRRALSIMANSHKDPLEYTSRNWV